MNFLLDSTVGLLIIYVLLKIVACLVHHFKVTPLKSGEYGKSPLPRTNGIVVVVMVAHPCS